MLERLYDNFIVDNRWMYLVEGLKNTLIITVFALLIGVVIGLLLAVIRTTYDKTGKLRFLNFLSTIYITVIRGTPSVIQLMIFSYCIFTSRIFSGIFIGSVAFGLNSGAYVAEIIRSGIMSIPNGQMEAGRSLGFNYTETMRYIILPQAIKNVLPAVFNEFIVLIKETAVIGYVAVQDLTKGGDIIRSRTFDAWTPLITVGLIYLLLTLFLSKVEERMEKSLKKA